MSEFRFFAYTDFEFSFNRSQNIFNLPIVPFQPTRRTSIDDISHDLNIPYTVFEILVAVFAVIGNLMVIVVFQRERKLRRRTNYYIVSLAMADFLVGSLGVPFAILASIGLPTNLHACLFTVSLLVVLCTISIFCLVAVSVDRYWAILYPMAYSRNVRTKTAIVIISMCWLAGSVVGFLPLFGWHADVENNQSCLFVEVMDYNYLVFLYFATIITPALLMLAFYAHIYRVIIKQVRQIVTMNPVGEDSRRSSTAQIQVTTPGRAYHGGMLRVLGAARKRDVKATQNLSIIVLFFMICWIPLYTINCIKAFCPKCYVHPKLTLFCIILSHLNSAVNPVLYAYHLKDFRLALKNLILKMMGIEIEQQVDTMHRYSLASQHRLQSMNSSIRNTIQPRIYIDSPIWLRQQQQVLQNPPLMPKCGVVTPRFSNIHQTIATGRPVTPNIERQIWNIVGASGGDEVKPNMANFLFSEKEKSAAPSWSNRTAATEDERCGSPYSYDNCTHTPSSNEANFEEVFLPSRPREGGVECNATNSSLIACALHENRSLPDASDKQTEILNCSDNDISRISNECRKQSPTNSNSVNATDIGAQSAQSSSSDGLTNSLIYVIDADTNPLSPGHRKQKLRKNPNLPKNSNKTTNKSPSHSCSCPSDTSPSPPNTALPTGEPSTHPSISNSSSSLSAALGSSSQSKVLNSEHSSANSNNNNNLNYYTFHHTPIQDFCTATTAHQRNHNRHSHGKFSPLRAMSNFLFPPIVKHSSLFQLFHPSAATAAIPNTISIAPPATTIEMTDSLDNKNRQQQLPQQQPDAIDQSTIIAKQPTTPPPLVAATDR